MSDFVARLLDSNRQLVATTRLRQTGDLFSGSIDLDRMPTELRRMFDAYDEAVNGQMLSLVDDIADQIAAAGLSAEFTDGVITNIHDLQVYPRSGQVSFRIATKPNPVLMNEGGTGYSIQPPPSARSS